MSQDGGQSGIAAAGSAAGGAGASAHLSVPAVLGFGLVVLSLLGCVVSVGLTAVTGDLRFGAGLLVTPLLALAGSLLGYLGLRQASRASARGEVVLGRGPALFALFAGLMSGIVQGSFAVAPLRVVWDIHSKLAPQTLMFVQEIDQGRLQSARGRLAGAVSGMVGDEQLTAFESALEAELGPIRDATFSVTMFKEVRRLGQTVATRGGTGAATGVPARPVLLVGDRGRAAAWVWLDNDAAKNDLVRITDVLVVLPGDRGLMLRPSGDAANLATALGLK